MEAASPVSRTYESLSRALEYHFLRPEFSDDDLAAVCRAARELDIATLVVRPSDVDSAVRWTAGGVTVGSVAGWPDGSSLTGAKLFEGRDLLRRGARELDFVLNTGKLLSRQFQYVETELLQMMDACEQSGAVCKVTIRNELLPDDLKIIALKIARRAAAPFISILPTAGDLELLRPLLKERVLIKAREVSGLDDALRCLDAGCARLGTAGAPALLQQWRELLKAEATAAPQIS